MKNSIVAILTLGTCILTIGCASTTTTSTESSASMGAKTIASSERLEQNLPSVAAPPTSTWGGNSLLR